MSFIVVEGRDRVGKSLQVRMLAELLSQYSLPVRVFSFPDYRSKTGEFISRYLRKQIVLTDLGRAGEDQTGRVVSPDPVVVFSAGLPASSYEALVFQCVQTCDKYALAGQIVEAVNLGVTVVCDRWWQSALVYGADDGISPQWLARVHFFLPQADVNILLDCSVEEIVQRAEAPTDRYERDLDKQKRLREAYLDLWEKQAGLHCHSSESFWRVLSSEGSVEEVHRRVADCVLSFESRKSVRP